MCPPPEMHHAKLPTHLESTHGLYYTNCNAAFLFSKEAVVILNTSSSVLLAWTCVFPMSLMRTPMLRLTPANTKTSCILLRLATHSGVLQVIGRLVTPAHMILALHVRSIFMSHFLSNNGTCLCSAGGVLLSPCLSTLQTIHSV